MIDCDIHRRKSVTQQAIDAAKILRTLFLVVIFSVFAGMKK